MIRLGLSAFGDHVNRLQYDLTIVAEFIVPDLHERTVDRYQSRALSNEAIVLDDVLLKDEFGFSKATLDLY